MISTKPLKLNIDIDISLNHKLFYVTEDTIITEKDLKEFKLKLIRIINEIELKELIKFDQAVLALAARD